jgi:hypothetical protein
MARRHAAPRLGGNVFSLDDFFCEVNVEEGGTTNNRGNEWWSIV